MDYLERSLFTGETIDKQKFKDLLPLPSKLAEENPAALRSQDFSMAEIFAHQFDIHASNVLSKTDAGQETIASEKFWQKITRYMKGIYQRYFRNEPIDADLEPIFAKILPDDKDVSARSKQFRKDSVTPLSQAPVARTVIGSHLKNFVLPDLEAIRKGFRDNWETLASNPDRADLNQFYDLARWLYAMRKFGPVRQNKNFAREVGRASNKLYKLLTGRDDLRQQYSIDVNSLDDDSLMQYLHGRDNILMP